jgi:molecular chaperone HtpG
MTSEKSERFEFQSEVKQLLDILVYSLYKNKDVFLRELISNAVDALNKIRLETLVNPEIEDKDLELKIDVSINKNQKKLVVEDTGIGMTRREIIDNIGTIARSGTAEFLKKLASVEKKDQSALIGKFGVGFYSSFMVAKEIHIYTKSYKKGNPALLWKSKGGKNFTIEKTVKKIRGTRIELLLKKEEEGELLDEFALRNIITRHSKFVPFPIYLEKEKIESIEAIWTQPKSSLKKKDYTEFFQFFENTKDEPETYIHLSSDAPVQFNAILYIPKTTLESLGFMKTEPGVDLYSRKVLIQKGSPDILPEYLRFLKGIIDSEEIPLNISRETIQNNIKIEKIKKHILKKLFEHLAKIKDKDRETYLKIWKNFNHNLKEGIIVDFESRQKIVPLLLFLSSKTDEGDLTDLMSYKQRMDKSQNEIYYISGKEPGSLEKNPALEAFRKRDIEVLYLTDPLDEFVFDHLREYDGKAFRVAEGAEIKIEEDQKEDKDYLENVEKFISFLKKTYGDRVADVRISRRLVESPCLLVHDKNGPSLQMEKIMKMTTKEYSFAKRIFEINPKNKLIKEMIRIHTIAPASAELKKISVQLLDNLMLQEGLLENVDSMIPRLQDILFLASKGIKPKNK